MGRTILCSNCKSTFDETVLAKRDNPNVCPVCKASLIDGESNNKIDINKEIDDPDLYFYDIDSEDEYDDNDLRDVWCNCVNCKEIITISYNDFEYLGKDYLKLKNGLGLKCEHCGKAFSNMFIPKRPDGWNKKNIFVNENTPRCPICSSIRIHKISITNKAVSAVAFGFLAAGHVSKTYKCESIT